MNIWREAVCLTAAVLILPLFIQSYGMHVGAGYIEISAAGATIGLVTFNAAVIVMRNRLSAIFPKIMDYVYLSVALLGIFASSVSFSEKIFKENLNRFVRRDLFIALLAQSSRDLLIVDQECNQRVFAGEIDGSNGRVLNKNFCPFLVPQVISLNTAVELLDEDASIYTIDKILYQINNVNRTSIYSRFWEADYQKITAKVSKLHADNPEKIPHELELYGFLLLAIALPLRIAKVTAELAKQS